MKIDLPMGADPGILYRAGEKIGARVEVAGGSEVRTRDAGQRIRFDARIQPLHPDHYRSRGYNGRRLNAVCWHGHREWMRAIYKAHPDAVIRTALATYRGAKHFEDTHEDTIREGLSGSQTCTCDE
ncbi:hypothetical protein [Micromonospora maritima]|uniref:hypothetical protein n=1 Tax=Micromonospora maritima TaxID=986711 RepID=UPI00157D2F3E|nr:hypothetical protein [Micromonospora maritima]